jgi:hemolysin III
VPVRDLTPFLGLCDPLSALTHGLAGLFLLVTSYWIFQRAKGDPRRVAGLAVWVVGVASMFLFSATYHGLPYGHSLKSTFWHLDHASIWIGLAASHVAVQVLFCPPETTRRRITILGALAVSGSIVEVLWLESLPAWVSPLLYVGMGWACFPVLLSAWRCAGTHVGLPMLIGGILATFGGFADSTGAPNLAPGMIEAHEVTHLATTLGGVFYWHTLFVHADGRSQPLRGTAPSNGGLSPAVSFAALPE